jgi:penicillin amidase
MRSALKWLWRGLAALAVLLVLAVAGGYVWLRTGLPEYDGDRALAGLSAPVTVVRDAHAVPHIFADNPYDAYFALGYAHAQDRLWQMDMQRRIGAGRVAEIVGPAGLPVDRYMRVLGIYRHAAASYEALPDNARRMLDSYARGINAWLETRTGPLPPEFLVLRYEPEPWQPADTLIWAPLMALQLSMNYREELLRARIADAIGSAALEDLYPDSDAGPVSIAGLGRALDRAWAALPADLVGNGASNAWVVAPERTGGGGAVLANDPHLGLSLPILWYLARIETPTLSLAGVTLPGAPLMVLGHNGHIAWGLTTTGSDVQDVFIEQVDPDAPGHYLAPWGSMPFESREETIRVAGNPPVTIRVRATRHGPVISDADPEQDYDFLEEGYVLALSFPGLTDEDLAVEALYRLNRARNREDYLAAMAAWRSPQQNVFFADRSGDIGMFVPGRVPIRAAGNGLVPSPGWVTDYDWTGFVPLDGLPRAFAPPRGWIANANNRVVPEDYPYLISAYQYEPPYRAIRLTEALDEVPAHGVADAAALQMDTVSQAARALLPLMTAFEPADDRQARALELLADWDYRMDRHRPEPLIFALWLRQLNRALYADELGPLFADYAAPNAQIVHHLLGSAPHWCDDVDTEATEDCASALALSLDRTLTGLTDRHGAEMEDWRWGDEHVAIFRHRLFGRIPVVGGLFDRSIATDGGQYTLNRGASAAFGTAAGLSGDGPLFPHVHGAGFRGVYDLADLSRSRFVIATGQSGHPLSPHFDDLIEIWRDGGYVTLAGSRESLADEAIGTLELRPAPDRPAAGPLAE